jgi:hypothetical protein
MAVYDRELTRPTVIFQNASLVAVGTPVVSAFIRMISRTITLVKTHTTGTYAIDIAWSNDGTNVTFTETNILATNNVPVAKTALGPYARFTITATGSNFTVHQTNVMA